MAMDTKQSDQASRIPHDLPPRNKFFFGPDQHKMVESVTQSLLHYQSRVVNLIGPEGIGINAIALDTAWRLLEQGAFTGGIFWLSSHNLTIDKLLQTIVTIGLSPSAALAGASTQEMLDNVADLDDVRKYLRSMPCLLILVNFDAVAHDIAIISFLDSLPLPSKALLIAKKVYIPGWTLHVTVVAEDNKILIETAVESEIDVAGHDIQHATVTQEPFTKLVEKAHELHHSYQQTGNLSELDGAIKLYTEIIDSIPSSSPMIAIQLYELGLAINDRYVRQRSLSDLDQAISCYQQAIECVTIGDSSRANLANFQHSLSIALSERYTRTGHKTDLNAAIQQHEQAFTLSLQRPPYVALDVARQTVLLSKALISLGDFDAATTMSKNLEDALAQLQPTTNSQEQSTIREPRTIYDSSTYDVSLWDQTASVLNDLLKVIRAIILLKANDLPEIGYEKAIQTLQIAHRVDQLTGGIFDLVEWMHQVSGLEFTAIEDAQEWPPRLSYLMLVAERYERREEWDAAVDAWRQAHDLLNSVNNDQNLARLTAISFRIGICLKKVGRWTAALKKQQENATAYKSLGSDFGKASAYLEMSHIYQMMNLYDPAMLYAGESYYLYRQAAEKTTDQQLLQSAQRGMADAKEALGNLELQLKLHRQSVSDLREAQKLYTSLGVTGKAAIIQQTIELTDAHLGANR